MPLLSHTATRWSLLPDVPVIVAVSGGRDSMTLLEVLARIAPRERLHVAHLDHRLRAEDSNADRLLVESRAAALGIACTVAYGMGTARDEATLREERWEFLESLARKNGALVATAHHGGDQLETLLFRLLRGTGPRGLAAMRERDGGRWKPWLAVAPETIAAWAETNGVHWRLDRTNAETTYARNALRHQVVPPLLEVAARYGGTDGFFARLADTCADTARLVDAADEAALARLALTHTDFFLRYPSAVTLDDTALDLITLRLGKPLLREQRRRALGARGSAATWGNGLQWRRSCGFDYVRTPAMRAAFERWHADAESALASSATTTPAPLVWRVDRPDRGRWRLAKPGDHVGHRKLKRRFLEARIPEPERALYVVLAEENQVLWAPLPGSEKRASAASFPFAVTH